MFEQSQRQCIQQQLSPPASIEKFVWTGDEDTPEEIERLKLRLQALIGWDDFPSDLEFRDVHTQMLFNERIEDESHRIQISGEHQQQSDIASMLCWEWFDCGGMMPKKLNMLAYAGFLGAASFACMLGLLVGKHTITFCWCCGALSASVKSARDKELLLFAGKSDIALQHAMVHPGGFMLEDTLLLVEAKTSLSQEALVMASFIYVPCQLQ